MKKLFLIFIVGLSSIVSQPLLAHADDQVMDQVMFMKAQVLRVVSQKVETVPATSVKNTYQTLQVEILDGTQKNQTVSVDNDNTVLKAGDIFYLSANVSAVDGSITYSVSGPYRLPWLYGLVWIFIICVLIFGGKQGFRGLIALALSFFAIGYVLFPGILHGYSPILMSIGVASVMIILGSYITHGFNKVTSSAVIGMIVTIIVTGLLAFASIHGARLSGFSTEESVYLNMNTNGSIDFSGLLLGGIIIGLLGVLYDAAIGQAVAVDELYHVGPHLSRVAIFRRALRMGREHIGALVNILAIAYVGASLPLLLLFYQSSTNFSLTINSEIFATEIVRAMVGSIGLILAVPVTTIIAVFILMKKEAGPVAKSEVEKEEHALEQYEHHH